MPTDKIDRRKILAAIGALGVSAPGVASAEHSFETDDDGCDACGGGKEKKKHDDKTEVCTFPCHKPKSRPERGKDHKWWWDGVITIQNCSNCVRDVEISVSQCLGNEPELDDHRSVKNLPSEGRVEVKEGERRSVWFRGTITGLSMEAGDLNVGVTMRSEHLNNASMCEQ